MWEHLITGTSAKLTYFPRISFPFPFPCPMRRDCLTVSAQEINVLILLNPVTHGETDGSSMCSVWVCFFIFVLWFKHCLFCLLPKRILSTGANSYIKCSSIYQQHECFAWWNLKERTVSNGVFRDAACLELRTDWKGSHDSWMFPVLEFLVMFFRVSLVSLLHAKLGDHCHTYLTGMLWG